MSATRIAHRLFCLLAVGAAAAALGCGTDDGGHVPMVIGDPDVFQQDVQPLFDARCASPSCHAGADRPLELYAPLRHRLDPDLLYEDGPLSPEELQLNQMRASCFIGDLDHGSTLAKKPLPPDQGGLKHAAGLIFENADDPEYLPLKDWVDATAAGLSLQEPQP